MFNRSMKAPIATYITLIACLLLAACGNSKSAVKDTTQQTAIAPEKGQVWQLVAMRGKSVSRTDNIITLMFNPEAGTFQGHSGCNRYFGNFKDLGKGKMELSELNATKMACAESFHKMEGAYMALLRRCDGYNLGEYTLELTQKGKVLISFEKYRQ